MSSHIRRSERDGRYACVCFHTVKKRSSINFGHFETSVPHLSKPMLSALIHTIRSIHNFALFFFSFFVRRLSPGCVDCVVFICSVHAHSRSMSSYLSHIFASPMRLNSARLRPAGRQGRGERARNVHIRLKHGNIETGIVIRLSAERSLLSLSVARLSLICVYSFAAADCFVRSNVHFSRRFTMLNMIMYLFGSAPKSDDAAERRKPKKPRSPARELEQYLHIIDEKRTKLSGRKERGAADRMPHVQNELAPVAVVDPITTGIFGRSLIKMLSV